MGARAAGKGGTGHDRLTDAECKAARTPGKLFDGRAMYLHVKPHGARLWRLKYRHGGKEKTYSIGVFPEISIAEARIARDQARIWLKEGKDPTIQRRVVKALAESQQGITFRVVGEEWLAKQSYSDGHAIAQRKRLNEELLPFLGSLPIAEINAAIVLDTLRKIENRGALETAAKCRRMASQIFRYAVQTGRATTDPAAMLVGAIKTPDTKHRATIAASQMPELFDALHAVPAELNTKLACYWLILSACRTGEMRFAIWGEISGERWRIPAERMKMKHGHVVPLSTQAQTILRAARPLRTSDDTSALLFPGFTRHGALSENALLALLARAGFFGRQTTHGFRASFSTWAHEEFEADPDVIEACLAHVKEGVRGIYNRSSYLSRRLELLQAWADQCSAWGMRLP